ncbi:MAG TPA: glycosyltransferase [Acidimicrobiia bacterium]|nr:glycosyltransferase [Acidimicrobiia bacterium]
MIHAALPARRRAGFDHRQFSLRHLAAAKDGQRVAVCIPAHNEEATVGSVVATAAQLRDVAVVDDVVVVDDNSTDATAKAAAAAGARVVRRDGTPSKGAAMRRAVASCDADVFVFLDADVTNLAPHFVVGLVGPLLLFPDVMLVKGAYRRSLYGRPGEGGRVTELVARPLLDRWFPELAHLSQPLAGETALRRVVTDAVVRLRLRRGDRVAPRRRRPLRGGGHRRGRPRRAGPPQPAAGGAPVPGRGGPRRRAAAGRRPQLTTTLACIIGCRSQT